MQHLYEYGAMTFEEILVLIDAMREARAEPTRHFHLGHAVALLVPGGVAE